jgi:LacI family transcriptional regulator
MNGISHVTLKDIADRLQLSTVTVSKSLRGYPDISLETRERIARLALELGYSPNYLARNLSSRHSRTIGVVVPRIAHFFLSQVIEAMYDEAYDHGYDIYLMVSQESAQRERQHIATLLSMRVDGILISVTQETVDASIFHRVRQLGVPLTFFDRVMDEEGFNRVAADNFGGACAATEQAIRTGYRHIAYLSESWYTSVGKERLAGYRAAFERYGIGVHDDWIVPCGLDEDDGYKGFRTLCESPTMPECIICGAFPAALGVCRAADQLGMTIPGDLDIISFGSDTLNQFRSPSLTYVEQPAAALGRTAFDVTVDSILANDALVTQSIRLPTRLVVRDTCVTPRQPAVQSRSKTVEELLEHA